MKYEIDIKKHKLPNDIKEIERKVFFPPKKFIFVRTKDFLIARCETE